MAKSSKIRQNGGTRDFIIGAGAFTRISAVEGISASERLQADLQKLKGSAADKRRAVLAETYGSKK